jgi:cysteinyl-tRNA synthetase
LKPSGSSGAAADAAVPSNGEIDGYIQERQQAKKSRDFARADQIRALLDSKGILLEDTKEGVRWKRK